MCIKICLAQPTLSTHSPYQPSFYQPTLSTHSPNLPIINPHALSTRQVINLDLGQYQGPPLLAPKKDMDGGQPEGLWDSLQKRHECSGWGCHHRINRPVTETTISTTISTTTITVVAQVPAVAISEGPEQACPASAMPLQETTRTPSIALLLSHRTRCLSLVRARRNEPLSFLLLGNP